MKCPKWQSENRQSAAFCKECGKSLELACAACGSVNTPDSKFCDKCGHALRKPEEASSIDYTSLSESSGSAMYSKNSAHSSVFSSLQVQELHPILVQLDPKGAAP